MGIQRVHPNFITATTTHNTQTTMTMIVKLIGIVQLGNHTIAEIMVEDMHMETFSLVITLNRERKIEHMGVAIANERHHIPFLTHPSQHTVMVQKFGDTIAAEIMHAMELALIDELIDPDMDSFLDWYNMFNGIEQYVQQSYGW